MGSAGILEGLRLMPEAEVERITTSIRTAVSETMKRQGAVVALSGGIDSSTVAALCVKALGPERVFGLQLPERDSSAETAVLSQMLVESLGIRSWYRDISPVLEALGCYTQQEAAFRRVIPGYGPGWKAKIVLPDLLESGLLRLFSLVAVSPEGEVFEKRLDRRTYLEILSATNFKQRVRTMLTYYHADRLNYAVAGTPNRLEYDQGFFVKLGDGAADLKPIAHLYKCQVYQLADFLGLPPAVLNRRPTTDTYSMPQTQEEFFFSLSYEKMDICLYGMNHNYPMEEVAEAAGLTLDQLRKVYRDIEQKRRTSAYLHLPAQLVEEIESNSAATKTAVPTTRL